MPAPAPFEYAHRKQQPKGMILHSELSRRRIRSIKKLIRVNKLEVVSVLRVDKDKGACVYLMSGCSTDHQLLVS